MSTNTLPPTLVGMRRLIASGQLTVDEALRVQRERLRQQSTDWHCVVHVFPTGLAPDSSLPLAGVGLAHKDLFTLRGWSPHCGTPDSVMARGIEGPLIKRLARDGSEPLGTLTMAEYACGLTGQNANYPLPVNPVHPTAAVGGSSSGSGVAVAAGLCYGSLGSDTAGSVRIPAATCGVLGLKPTNNMLSLTGMHPLAPSLDCAGVIARSALDAAHILATVVTPAQRRALLPKLLPTSSTLSKGEWMTMGDGLPRPRALRIGACWTHTTPSYSAEPKSVDLLSNMAVEYDVAGNPKIINLECLAELIRYANVMLQVEAATLHMANMRNADSILSEITRATTVPGAVIPGTWYYDALNQRKTIIRSFLSTFLQDNDVLLTPVLPHGVPSWDTVLVGAPTFEANSLLALSSWTAFVNYLGLPAVVFPIGEDDHGRPISAQAIGRPRSEALLLSLAYAIERDRYGANGFISSPPVFRTPKNNVV